MAKYNKELQEERKALTKYFKEIGKYRLLTREEEQKYLPKAQEEIKSQKSIDSELPAFFYRDKLTKHNLKLVVSRAKRYLNKGLPFFDLINEGNIGLLTAIERFDTIKYSHIKFSTYAVRWINKFILMALEKNKNIKLTQGEKKKKSNIKKSQRNFLELPIYEQINSISKELGIPKKEVINYLTIAEEPISLDEYTKDNRINNLEPFQILCRKELKKDLTKVLNTLTKKQRTIIQDRYPFNGTKKLTYGKIGKKFNVTVTRIKQIRKEALNKLQNPRYKRRLEDYLL